MLLLWDPTLWDPGALIGRLASWWFLERVCFKKRNAAVCENQRAGRAGPGKRVLSDFGIWTYFYGLDAKAQIRRF